MTSHQMPAGHPMTAQEAMERAYARAADPGALTDRIVTAARALSAHPAVDDTFWLRLGVLRDAVQQLDGESLAAERRATVGRFADAAYRMPGDVDRPCPHRRDDICDACAPGGAA